MKPEIVQRPGLLLAGVMNCGKDVSEIDIHRLWKVYEQSESGITKRIDGAWYELHIGNGQGHGIYSVIAGVGISEIGELPIEVSVKVIPVGKYAHFAHCMKQGGFDEAFTQVEAWVKESGAVTHDFGLQLYDSDYDPSDENSILHIYIPLV